MRGEANLDAVQKYASKLDAAAGSSAAITLAAIADEHHVIDSLHWSYDADHSAAGYLKVMIGSTQYFYVKSSQNFPNAGSVEFPRGLVVGALNEAVVITLRGSDTAGGKLNCTYR